VNAQLSDVLRRAGLVGAVVHGSSDLEITSIHYDSRRVVAGSLFCCLPGSHSDGHDHAAAAVAAGAVALLVERRLDAVDAPQVEVPNGRLAMGLIAAAFQGHPARSLCLVGVTGTNGKTTTTSLIEAVLRAAGNTTRTIGTLTGAFTTPESVELQATLRTFADEGVSHVVMEVSSHALALQRVAGCRFAVAVFTNLGVDHLDFHGTVAAYFEAKRSLFEPELSERAVVNVDDPRGALLVREADIPTVAYSRSDISDVVVSGGEHSYLWRGHRIRVPLGGSFNVLNSLAAATTCVQLGVAEHTIADALAIAPPVPGRFEAVRAGQPFEVIVDFAHTAEGLREALTAAREVTAGELTVVFGCGGDRDRGKRPDMGRVASELADRVVVTSDNPRSEDPLAIANAITEGVPDDYRSRVVMELDRRRAIAIAVAAAKPGDLVLIAGKGHERTQTIGDLVVPFDDRAVAQELLEAL
jgi:UDP-N-acetylmuramoyl-L-alanyl-D-glutamate--2,6-diaminopimelate ligase